jgi:hypothetical protein
MPSGTEASDVRLNRILDFSTALLTPLIWELFCLTLSTSDWYYAWHIPETQQTFAGTKKKLPENLQNQRSITDQDKGTL